MEHPTDVYDVTFDDEVTVKCYFYPYGIDMANIVSTETKLGCAFALDELVVDNEKKTIFIEGYDSFCLDRPKTYNYFQNSNLSAWKVWYCLDNDKSRFAWADDNVIGDIEKVIVYYPERTNFGQTIPAHDVVYTLTNETQIANGVTYFKLIRLEEVHTGDMVELFVNTKNINTETTLYSIDTAFGTTTVQASPFGISIKSINYNTPPTEEGRGVIYRLIDEWNNDVGYDFKNVQFVRPCTDGYYDENNGSDTWCYTFSFNLDGNIVDGSLKDSDDNNYFWQNRISCSFELTKNVLFSSASDTIINSASYNNTLISACGMFYSCSSLVIEVDIEKPDSIYINNKKVLTEE